jgi:hypothetical protein
MLFPFFPPLGYILLLSEFPFSPYMSILSSLYLRFCFWQIFQFWIASTTNLASLSEAESGAVLNPDTRTVGSRKVEVRNTYCIIQPEGEKTKRWYFAFEEWQSAYKALPLQLSKDEAIAPERELILPVAATAAPLTVPLHPLFPFLILLTTESVTGGTAAKRLCWLGGPTNHCLCHNAQTTIFGGKISISRLKVYWSSKRIYSKEMACPPWWTNHNPVAVVTETDILYDLKQLPKKQISAR